MNRLICITLALVLAMAIAIDARMLFEGNRKPNNFKVNMNDYTQEQLSPQFTEDDNPFEHSGYVTVNSTAGAKMYYLYFPSQDGNKDAPLLIWLQGGPGCSSMSGAFLEMGPYAVNKETLKLEKREHSWNEHYDMLFIDNPVGTGFSYAHDQSVYVTNQVQVARDLYKTIQGVFDKYPQLIPKKLYITGESYAGKYVPSITSHIVDQNKQGNNRKINIAGMAIGDGLTDPLHQMEYEGMAYPMGLISDAQAAEAKKRQEEAVSLIRQERWGEAYNKWNSVLNLILTNSGVNVYDIREFGNYDFAFLDKYLNLPYVQKLMHAERVWNECDTKVYEYLQMDMIQSVAKYVTNVLDNGVDVLIYNAQYDLIIPTLSSFNWVRHLEWSGQGNYNQSPRHIYKVGNDIAGYRRSTNDGRLTQFVLIGAGHLAPMNQIKNSQAMVTDFINGHFH